MMIIITMFIIISTIVVIIFFQNIDLHALTGWIPERISMSSKSIPFDADKQFRKIHDRFHMGHCLITMATGELPKEEADRAGLVPSHAYAMLDVQEFQVGTSDWLVVGEIISNGQEVIINQLSSEDSFTIILFSGDALFFISQTWNLNIACKRILDLESIFFCIPFQTCLHPTLSRASVFSSWRIPGVMSGGVGTSQSSMSKTGRQTSWRGWTTTWRRPPPTMMVMISFFSTWWVSWWLVMMKVALIFMMVLISTIISSSFSSVPCFVDRNILDRLRIIETLLRRHLHQLEPRHICLHQLSAPVSAEVNHLWSSSTISSSWPSTISLSSSSSSSSSTL